MPDGSSIAIDSESMRAIVQRAILESLTPESKELVIADAIKQLTLRPELPKDRYAYNKPIEYGPSPLEQAFTRAVMEMSHEVVREYLGDADVKEHVKAILRGEIERLVDEDSEDLSNGYGGWPSTVISQAVADVIKVKLERPKD